MKRSLIQVLSNTTIAKYFTKIVILMISTITLFIFSYIKITAPVFVSTETGAESCFKGLCIYLFFLEEFYFFAFDFGEQQVG